MMMDRIYSVCAVIIHAKLAQKQIFVMIAILLSKEFLILQQVYANAKMDTSMIILQKIAKNATKHVYLV